MTTKENAEKQARELLGSCIRHTSNGTIAELTTLILRASQVEELEKEREQALRVATLMQAERDSYKEKAEALDWLEESGQIHHVHGYATKGMSSGKCWCRSSKPLLALWLKGIWIVISALPVVVVIYLPIYIVDKNAAEKVIDWWAGKQHNAALCRDSGNERGAQLK